MDSGFEIFGIWFDWGAWSRAAVTAVVVGVLALGAQWIWSRRKS
jgi:hypothetical protein